MQDKTDNNNFAIQVRASSTQIKLYIDTTSKTMTFTGANGDWTIGAWRHVSVQLDSTQRVFMASLMFDFQTSGTYWPQKTGFYFKGDIEFGTSPAFALQELRIWNHFKSWEEIKLYAYTDMSEYHSGLLVSYWRLKPILNFQQLEDSSLNPQLSGTFSGGPLDFGYDESYPVVCKYQQVWDYTNKMCINIQASKQKIFKFNNVNSQLLTVDYGKVVVQWNIEFWFKPDLAINPSPILFDHSNMWVAIENSVDFKVYSKPSTSWPHQLQNFTFTKWNHILISFYDDPVDTTTYARYGVCLNYACIDDSVQFVKAGPKTYIVAPNYAGYLKEMRVWDWGDASTQNGFFKVALTDYMRFTWFSSDSDVFRHFMPESVSSFGLSFDSSYIPGGNYAPFKNAKWV
ncbi:hypothetical protein FGO68_gene14840 [Halteria grandinella]|uniref:Uncharacterized protein n=1 Tax=Halteria grandinella TaxID=5974 RepID=A0A8J8NHL6_HALGN|nr:hypothetical protein FGO68_gene14840 [Halteria grandinella]